MPIFDLGNRRTSVHAIIAIIAIIVIIAAWVFIVSLLSLKVALLSLCIFRFSVSNSETYSGLPVPVNQPL